MGAGVLFAPIAIIEVPLDFTEVCKEMGGRRDGAEVEEEREAWAT